MSLTISDADNDEKIVTGKMRLVSTSTKGKGQWYQIFIDKSEFNCSLGGYNACDTGILMRDNHAVVDVIYLEQRTILLRNVRYIIELTADQRVLLSRNQQMTALHKYNSSIESTNHRTFVFSLVLNVLLVLIISVYDARKRSEK